MSTTISQTKATERFKKTIGGSMKSLLNAGGRTYFLLEHKTNSKKFKTGQTKEFIGDYVEIGRGNKYALSFGEDCNTVSRPHAAIVRQNDGWVIKHLSKTNPTLVNNQAVNGEQPLVNGDEIQFSFEGPRVAFLQPANNKVSNMGMTIRVKAMMNEAIKPYKTALTLVAAVFILSIVGFTVYSRQQNLQLDQLLTEQKTINKGLADSIRTINKSNTDLQGELKKLAVEASRAKKRVAKLEDQQKQFADNNNNNKSTASPAALGNLYPDVYFIKSTKIITIIGKEVKEMKYGLSGTGFLLSDGRFVTARHVVEPWSYIKLANMEQSDKTMVLLNLIANNGGKVIMHFTAYSPSGARFNFTTSNFTVEKSKDITKSKTDPRGNTYVFSQASLKDGTDWAYARTTKKGKLNADPKMSVSLQASTRLNILGYPFGIGVNSESDIKPTYNECHVSRDGLDKGIIDISGRGFDSGNSGGPVFVQTEKGYTVIGIVSASIGNQGIIVPISAIR